jgi:hypothetical protein
LRNEIAHEVKKVEVSKTNVITLWDNLMNIMDISVTIFLSVSDPKLRESLDSDYRRGRGKARSKAIYKICSDTIMSNLFALNTGANLL